MKGLDVIRTVNIIEALSFFPLIVPFSIISALASAACCSLLTSTARLCCAVLLASTISYPAPSYLPPVHNRVLPKPPTHSSTAKTWGYYCSPAQQSTALLVRPSSAFPRFTIHWHLARSSTTLLQCRKHALPPSLPASGSAPTTLVMTLLRRN